MPGTPEPEAILCPACTGVVPVPDGWRLVQCPKCGHTITRMEGDPAYD